MGLLASLLSAAFSSAKDLISKRLASRLDGTSSTFASFAFALPYYAVVLTVLFLVGQEVFTLSLVFFMLVMLRSMTDTLAEGLKMHAFGHGDISIVASFFSISPLFLLITSPLITQDPLTVPGVTAVILVVGGSLFLVYRPSSVGWATQRRGIFLAMGAAFFFSLNSCFDRLAVQRGTPVFAGFTMTLLSALFLAPLVLIRRERREGLYAYQGGLWIRGLLEVAFMVSKLTALQYLQAPYVAGLQRLSVVLSILGGRVFFQGKGFRAAVGSSRLDRRRRNAYRLAGMVRWESERNAPLVEEDGDPVRKVSRDAVYLPVQQPLPLGAFIHGPGKHAQTGCVGLLHLRPIEIAEIRAVDLGVRILRQPRRVDGRRLGN
jgi:uncharacterized membrane protein